MGRSRITKHHMSNRRYGFGNRLNNGGSNILRMRENRHQRLHRLFKNMSWEEIHDTLNSIFGVGEPKLVVRVMSRVSRMKSRVA